MYQRMLSGNEILRSTLEDQIKTGYRVSRRCYREWLVIVVSAEKIVANRKEWDRCQWRSADERRRRIRSVLLSGPWKDTAAAAQQTNLCVGKRARWNHACGHVDVSCDGGRGTKRKLHIVAVVASHRREILCREPNAILVSLLFANMSLLCHVILTRTNQYY